MQETSPEKPGKYPLLEAFFGNPHANAAEVAYSFMVAINEGKLDPGVLEEALKETKKSKAQAADIVQEKINQRKTLLLEHLKGFSGSDPSQLKVFLNPFLVEHYLELEPKTPMVIGVGNINENPDWITPDGQIGLIVKQDSIWMYSKLNDRWMPYSPKS